MRFGSLYNSGYQTGDVMTLTSDGRVGIGTSSPARELSIGDGTGSPNIQLISLLLLVTLVLNLVTLTIAMQVKYSTFTLLTICSLLPTPQNALRIDALGNASFNTTNISPASNNVFGTAILQYGGAKYVAY